jgi:site-specific DNA recombinase
VGWVEDIDVSGGVEPWKRPEFTKWLPSTIGKEVSAIEHRIAMEESRADEYDIICALKIDRLSRRVLHVHSLLEWCAKNGKEVPTVEDGINLTTQMGKLLLSLIASFAEGELEAIKARAKSSHNHLVKEGRWRGGRTPYGYREEKQETGDGWKLALDDYGTDTAGTLREVVRRLIDSRGPTPVRRRFGDSWQLVVPGPRWPGGGRGLAFECQCMPVFRVKPPSTGRMTPVMNADSSEARKRAASATS